MHFFRIPQRLTLFLDNIGTGRHSLKALIEEMIYTSEMCVKQLHGDVIKM